jgi:hypothetical protein
MKTFTGLILLFLTSGLYAIPFEMAQKADKASQFYIQKEYNQALELYEEFLANVKQEEVKELYDKQLYAEVTRSVQELKELARLKPLLPLFRKFVSESKNEQFNAAVQTGLEIREYLKVHSMNRIPYFEYVVRGELEDYLISKKKESLSRFTAEFFRKVKEDKNRKKTVAFAAFQKDPSIRLNIEDVLVNTLSNVIEISGGFNLSRKKLTGEEGEPLEQAKEQKIDFVVSGKYEQATRNTVQLTFFVQDPFVDKILVTATVRTSLDAEFFDTLEKIAMDMEKNLKSYSRLEDFALIRYTKEEGEQLRKEEVEETEQREALPYLEDRIYVLEKSYVASLIRTDRLENFDKAGREIYRFNQVAFPRKIDYQQFLNPKKELIIDLFHKNSELGEAREDLNEAKRDKDYEDYLDAHKDAREAFAQELYVKYTGLKPLVRELENSYLGEKAAVGQESRGWPVRNDFSHRVSLRVGSGALLSAAYALNWKTFYIAPTVGYVKGFDAEYPDYERDALPMGSRLGWNIVKLPFVEPYVYTGGLYYYGLTNYENRVVGMGGAGVHLFEYLFLEGGWMMGADMSGPAIGFGTSYQF